MRDRLVWLFAVAGALFLAWFLWPDPAAGAEPYPAATVRAQDGMVGSREPIHETERTWLRGQTSRSPLLDDARFRDSLATYVGRLVTASGTAIGNGTVKVVDLHYPEHGPDYDALSIRQQHLTSTTASEPDGRFALTGLWPRGGYFLAAQGPEGHVLDDQSRSLPPLTPGATTDLGDIILHESAQLEGVVHDPAGNPVASAKIVVVPSPSRDCEPAFCAPGGVSIASKAGCTRVVVHDGYFDDKNLEFAYGQTDANGVFVIQPVRRGRKLLVVRPQPDHVGAMRYVTCAPASHTDIGTVVVTMQPRIHGVVRDSNGKVVPGVQIAWGARPRPHDEESEALGFLAGVTDGNGQFRIRGLQSTPDVVAVSRGEGHSWYAFEVSRTNSNLDGSLVLQLDRSLNLVCRLRCGSPSRSDRRLTVRLAPQHWTGTHHSGAESTQIVSPSADGTFYVRGLSIGLYNLELRDQGGTIISSKLVNMDQDKSVTLDEREKHRLRVVVTAPDNQAVSNARVLVLPGDDSDRCVSEAWTDTRGNAWAGTFGYKTCLVRVSHPGYQDSVEMVRVHDGSAHVELPYSTILCLQLTTDQQDVRGWHVLFSTAEGRSLYVRITTKTTLVRARAGLYELQRVVNSDNKPMRARILGSDKPLIKILPATRSVVHLHVR